MFGTLVICLPSPHTGGDLVVRHQGQEKTYRTAEVQPSVLCWYSDVHHEVLPVTSGYRWVLTYNLAISPDLERPTAALLQPETGNLEKSLDRWIEHLTRMGPNGDESDVPHLYYMLEHEYSEASLALRALKTVDLARVQCLRDLSTKLDLDVFLAVLEKSEDGGVDMDWGWRRSKKSYFDDYDDYDDRPRRSTWHELNEVYETTISIKKLVDMDGNLLRSGMKIDDLEENLIPECDPFEGVKDRNEDYEGYTGNSVRQPRRGSQACSLADTNMLQGPTATHFYRKAVSFSLAEHE
jgi:hypothetical protein